MTGAQKDAMRATLNTIVDKTIADYHGFMEGTVHDKAKVLLGEDFRSNLIENLAAAADAAGEQT